MTAAATVLAKPGKGKTPSPSTVLLRKAALIVEPPDKKDKDKEAPLTGAPRHAPRPAYWEFAQVVLKAMLKKNLSQSDLAREIWGTTKDSRGHDVARNRDRITDYVKGRAYPEPKNLEKLAEALELPIEALQIERSNKGVSRLASNQADVQLHLLAAEPDRCLLIVQKIISTKLALEIAKLINDERQADNADADLAA